MAEQHVSGKARDEKATLHGNCEMCESEEEVTWYCVDCQERLCEQCKLHHLKNKKLKNDKIISIDDARENTELTNQDAQNTCALHGENPLIFFCETCEDSICSDCLSESHRSHAWETKEQSLKSLKTALSDLAQLFKENLARARDVAEKDDAMHTFFIKRLAVCKQSIIESANMICEETAALKEDYIQEILSIEAKEIARYKENHTLCSLESKQLKTSIKDIENEMRSENQFHLHVLSKEMKSKASDFRTPKEHKVLPPSFEKIPFQKQNLMAIFGRLKTPEESNVFRDFALDMKVTHLKTNSERKIIAICPLDDGSTWLSYSGSGDDTDGLKEDNGDKRLVLINEHLHEIARSCEMDREVVNMTLFKSKDILLTCILDTRIRKLSCNGKKLLPFADLTPNYARSVCVQKGKDDVIVCANTPNSSGLVDKSQHIVVRLSLTGSVLQEIRLDDHDPEVFQLPYRLTSFSTGEIFVVDRAPNDHRIVCVDKRGRYVFSWRGEGIGDIHPLDVAAIDDKNIALIVDESFNKIYALSKDGYKAKVLLDKKKREMGPRCIAMDNRARMWIGCNRGMIILGEVYLPMQRSGSNRSTHFSV